MNMSLSQPFNPFIVQILTTVRPCPTQLNETICLKGEIKCPGVPDKSGCPVPAVCVPFNKTSKTGEPCAPQCPVTCPEGQYVCSGYQDRFGCPLPDTCTPKYVLGQNGSKCPGVCPVVCHEEDMFLCKGIVNKNGCYTNDICLPKYISLD